MSKALSFVSFFWSHRSIWATIFFIAVVGFFDENSYWNLFKQQQANAVLRAEIASYEKEYTEGTQRLHQLSRSQDAVEKIARVNLLMKSDDEDIYIVEE